MGYELFCRSVQGAGHIKKGMPCEDYGEKFENEDCKIFVLGDGHGDPNCTRSSYGSRAVCEIAISELGKFAGRVKEEGLETRLFDEDDCEKLVLQLVSTIFGKWSCRVKDDFENHPLTEAEEAQAKDCIGYYRQGKRIEHIYGTTFIAGLMTDGYLLLLQQGDGRCVVFDKDGEAGQPIPWDERCIANVSTSVCDPDAAASCRYHVIDLSENPILACLLGSDGVEDSFGSMDMMHSYYREELQFAFENGVEAFERRLGDTLPTISRQGSCDDITICGLIDREALGEKLDKFRLENERVRIGNAISKAEERLRTMGPKLDYLARRCAEADAAYTSLKKKYAELEEEYRNIYADIENYRHKKFLSLWSVRRLEGRMSEILREKADQEKEMQACSERKKLCDDEYDAYKQKYESFVLAVQENKAKYRALSAADDDGDSAALSGDGQDTDDAGAFADETDASGVGQPSEPDREKQEPDEAEEAEEAEKEEKEEKKEDETGTNQ